MRIFFASIIEARLKISCPMGRVLPSSRGPTMGICIRFAGPTMGHLKHLFFKKKNVRGAGDARGWN